MVTTMPVMMLAHAAPEGGFLLASLVIAALPIMLYHKHRSHLVSVRPAPVDDRDDDEESVESMEEYDRIYSTRVFRTCWRCRTFMPAPSAGASVSTDRWRPLMLWLQGVALLLARFGNT